MKWRVIHHDGIANTMWWLPAATEHLWGNSNDDEDSWRWASVADLMACLRRALT